MKIIVASGYFLIYHAGHEEYLRKAKALGDKLIVILNSDQQQFRKYGQVVMPIEQRLAVLKSIRHIDDIFLSIDFDGDVSQSIRTLSNMGKVDIFAKGGDRTKDEIPEKRICDELGIEIIDGLGEKIQSSSHLLKL